ncbi:MAG: ATP synthase subunit I [[Actinobacillus] rossii]|uniref:F0F1 ATP synthase subunit I n=1 Tax=[Actinobacillus] rossii TaxID=123820 RepID=A0A380TN07_9PAST|nr:ATP synthase subunit I [[Actinobacillus] rossii]MDD7568568.1 ATP synthase subunit I [[Actinobacillus] rossii]MDY4505954.1 ATP synthase subunit I [[Actinobacillus] rossii]MDY5793645.1 ATP synthase subunit I [[Actinobacillus] rossii]SUT88653.1 F0F1 ATP synthase subunit I [[Actinobacillus] rossii]
MSFVVNQAKQHYRHVLVIELGIITLLTFIVLVFKFDITLSFLFGLLSSFLPFCLFVYWIFFRYSPKNQSKMTALYRGEGLKWLLTIVLVVASFKLIMNLNVLAFFIGYIMMLFFNNLIPFVLSKVKI